MKLFRSPFEKLSLEYQQDTANATMVTATAVSPGGELFKLFSDMNKHLKQIAENTKGGNKVQVSGRGAKALGAALPGIGTGVKLIAEAINSIPDSKEAQAKMNVIVGGIDAMKSLGKAILMFAGMLALSLPLLIIGIMAVPLAMGAMLLVGGVFYILDKLNIERSMRQVSIGFMLGAAAIVSLSAAFVLSDMLLNETEDGWGTAAKVTALIAGTALVFFMAGKFAMPILKGALVMAVASVPLILIAYSMSIFSDAIKPDKDGWVTIAQVGATVTGLGLLMAAAGAAAPFIIPGAAAMILAGGALISVALGMAGIAEVFKPGKMDYMFADSGNATKPVKVLGITLIEGGRPMSNLEWALLSIARSFMLPPLAIAGMYAGAPALIMSGIALLTIAKGIEKFQALDIDYEVLPNQIGKVVTVLGDAFGAVGEKYPGGGAGILSAITGAGAGDSLVAQGISAVSGMGRALGGIAAGVQNMALLRIPTKWDKNGNPIEFRQLTEADFIAVGENTKRIVLALSQTFSEVGASDAAQGSTWFTSSTYEKGIDVVKRMGDPLIKLSEFVKEFSGITTEEIALVGLKTNMIIKTLTGAFMQKDAEGNTLKPTDMQFIARSYSSVATSYTKMTKSFIDFKDGINDLDIEKVTEVRKLYEGLAALTQNGGENIVEQMGESMVEAIEVLVEKLGSFAEDVKGSAAEVAKGASKMSSNVGTKLSSKGTDANSKDSGVSMSAEVVEAIKNLERVLGGVQQVYVVNQEGGI